MISKDELIKSVAQSCGVSVEISAFFFEVYVNRLSNKLKPGDLLHFQNHGYFHKRNCRIHIEKTSDSPTPKSYLIQLVLFSSEMKINKDLSDVHFLKIPNLKTLWIDDKDFQKSLNAGDFAPHTERNQLIKSFATKAEVIISGLRKDYDSDLVEELIIPLTFDLNFLVKSGQKSSTSASNASKLKADNDSPSTDKVNQPIASTEKTRPDNITSNQKTKETTEDGLPWNYGTKFLEKDKSGNVNEAIKSDNKSAVKERPIITKTEINFRKDQGARLKDFEPVSSHVPIQKDGKSDNVKSGTVKFSVSKGTGVDSENALYNNKFTEVKSRTESYRQRGGSGKSKNKFDRYSRKYSDEKAFTQRRNFLPIVAVISFIVIVASVIYIYFIKADNKVDQTDIVLFNIKPPANVNVIDRNFDFIVSYPYPKMENRIEMSGFNDDLFATSDIKSEIKEETKPESKTKTEKTTDRNETPKVETKTKVEKTKPIVEQKKESVNRIFLYRNFYVVYIGSYRSEDEANRIADNYFDLGYNAIVEEIEGRDGRREYKLSVGDFTSEDFARQFQEKYIK